MSLSEQTLDDLRDEIEGEAEDIDIKPYSHNIVGLLLGEVARRFGKAEANQCIVDFGLEAKGWSQVKEEA
jgi:hypothetical protein